MVFKVDVATGQPISQTKVTNAKHPQSEANHTKRLDHVSREIAALGFGSHSTQQN
jgi:hypothetical protein